MKKQIKTQFTAKEGIEAAKDDFFRHLKSGNAEWLGLILFDIKKNYIDRGSPVTDILVRENKPTLLSIVKAHIPYRQSQNLDGLKPNFKPELRDFEGVLNCFYEEPESHIKHEFSHMDSYKTAADNAKGQSIDFSFSVDGLGIFRVNYSHEINGASMAIRILSYELPSFELVGYWPPYVNFIKGMVQKAKIPAPGANGTMGTIDVSEIPMGGLILHVGPTGSGKTTAIAAELNYLAESTSGGFITYENPIEYRYLAVRAPVRQFELGKDLVGKDGKTPFETIPWHMLRNNPSVIMIGEARNHEEMRIVLDIASRGHLVFTTIHASNALEALSTLYTAVGEDKHLISNSLKALIAHKLVRSNEGKIHGMHEIVMINETLKSDLMQENPKEALKRFKSHVYTEKNEGLANHVQTFQQALEDLVSKQIIEPGAKKQIETSNYGLFVS